MATKKKTTDSEDQRYGPVDPKKVVSARVYNAALKTVNYYRECAGLDPLKELPKGKPNETCGCPIQKALAPLGVTEVHTRTFSHITSSDDYTYMLTSTPKVRIMRVDRELPESLKTFVRVFDKNGKKVAKKLKK